MVPLLSFFINDVVMCDAKVLIGLVYEWILALGNGRDNAASVYSKHSVTQRFTEKSRSFAEKKEKNALFSV